MDIDSFIVRNSYRYPGYLKIKTKTICQPGGRTAFIEQILEGDAERKLLKVLSAHAEGMFQ